MFLTPKLMSSGLIYLWLLYLCCTSEGGIVTSATGNAMVANSQTCDGGSWLDFCNNKCHTSLRYSSVCSFNSTSENHVSDEEEDDDDDDDHASSEEDRVVSLQRRDMFDDNFPFGDNVHPWGNTKFPWGNAPHPWGYTTYPWGNSENPWGDTKYPWGDNPHPWGKTNYPWGNSINPWGDSTFPWGNMDVPKIRNSLTYISDGNIISNVSENSGDPASGTNGLCYCTKMYY